MTIKQFIEKAIRGGWYKGQYRNFTIGEFSSGTMAGFVWKTDTESSPYSFVPTSTMFLDPLAWQAVGKVEKGKKWSPQKQWRDGSEIRKAGWHENMHRMIDALAEGKTIEQFLETL